MAGVDITTVKALLGHKTITMTLRYSHLAPFHATNALSVLDEALTRSQLYKNYTIEQKRDSADMAKSLNFHGGPSQN